MAPWRRPYAYILVAVLACSLPYIFVQPVLRYRYMISTLLIFCALDGAFRLIAYIRANGPGKAKRVRRQFVTVGASEAGAPKAGQAAQA
jgi:hypothetical protein